MTTANFTAPADKLLTADQLAAKLARREALQTRRAELRARIATEMGRSISDRQVLAEVAAQLRMAR